MGIAEFEALLAAPVATNTDTWGHADSTPFPIQLLVDYVLAVRASADTEASNVNVVLPSTVTLELLHTLIHRLRALELADTQFLYSEVQAITWSGILFVPMYEITLHNARHTRLSERHITVSDALFISGEQLPSVRSRFMATLLAFFVTLFFVIVDCFFNVALDIVNFSTHPPFQQLALALINVSTCVAITATAAFLRRHFEENKNDCENERNYEWARQQQMALGESVP